ncbi:cytochrome c oxidase assembly protein subunit 15 [Bacillus oleivorans]|uniref:Heme A synthase n=1 Tax=Bacillus oleivorans TaxID=1448271 RepID=A0A285D0L9_9BACI|nr:heme A synthase [Bacillus oleivorans]SNX73299.1 cytochrome c oxidase assembly protein subunit 15 [Bacillus oleivorans]
MQRRGLKVIAILSTIAMLFVLLGGALVTKTDSGDGCGDSWPLCHGQLIPEEITSELIIEMAHRIVSGLAGILVLSLSILTWKYLGPRKETRFLSVLSFLFLVLQALIGAAAVKWGQSDFVLALHFGISLISFASVFLLTLIVFEDGQKYQDKPLFIDKRMKRHIIGIFLYTYTVVYTGALVRHVNASLVCPDWPLCVNSTARLLPTNFHEWVQMGHRFAAGFVFIWIFYIMILAFKHYKQEKTLLYGWVMAFILVLLQVTAGALVVLSNLSLGFALAHALFISLLFALLSYFILLLYRSQLYFNSPEKAGQQVNLQ